MMAVRKVQGSCWKEERMVISWTKNGGRNRLPPDNGTKTRRNEMAYNRISTSNHGRGKRYWLLSMLSVSLKDNTSAPQQRNESGGRNRNNKHQLWLTNVGIHRCGERHYWQKDGKVAASETQKHGDSQGVRWYCCAKYRQGCNDSNTFPHTCAPRAIYNNVCA